MAYENILTRTEGRAGVVQLNRPKQLNALNSQVMSELADALEEFDNNSDVGCMVITGNERAFAAGADIKEMSGATAVDMLLRNNIGGRDRLKAITKPIIAAVSGWCLGGGCELAMSCEIIIASETAQFGQPEINIGVMPGAGGTQRLVRAIGKSRAMELVLTGGYLAAREAKQLGLVSRVVPVEMYLEEAVKLANDIASKAPIATRIAKEAINRSFEVPLSAGIDFERRQFFFLFATEDQQEGMQAFIEKRKPDWKGR